MPPVEKRKKAYIKIELVKGGFFMPSINMLSSADLVKGQGVGSAYYEQVNLVSQGLKEKYQVMINAKKRCDIVHFHTINPEYFITMNRNKKRSTFVGYVHFLPETVEKSLDIPKVGKKLFYKYMLEFYNSMDYLVTVNPYFIHELEKYGIKKEKISYIPNYVSDDLFFPVSKKEKEELREVWQIPKETFVVLGVGQVQTRKGVLDFVETARKMPDSFFIWAGGFSFGSMTDGYKELKEIMANPPENVLFLGIIEREKMNEVYNLCDVMFLPSYQELFPMTILESMCIGLPILLRDLEIYPDILFHYYLKGNNLDDFISILTKLKQDGSFYQEWSQKSSKGHLFYSRENVLKMWKEFYDRVYEENRNRIEQNGQKERDRNLWKIGKEKKKQWNREKRRRKRKVSEMREKLLEDFDIEKRRISNLFQEEKKKE